MSMLSMLGSISGLVSGIGNGFTIAGELANKAFSAVAEFFDEYVMQPLSDAWNWIEESWEDVKTWASDAWESIGGWWDEWIATPISDFWEWIKEGWEDLKSWGADAWESIGEWWDEWVSQPIDDFWTWIEEGWEDLKTWASDAWESIGGWWDEWVEQPIDDFWIWIEEGWEDLKTWASDAWESIGGWWDEWIEQPINDFWTWIEESWKDLKGWGSDAWDSIGDAWDEYIGGPIDTFFGWIEGAWDTVTESIETGWEELTSIFDFEWKDLLPDWSWSDIIPEALSDFFSMDTLENLWDSITGMFDAVMEPIKGAINDYIIDTVNDVTGYELPVIGESLRSLTGLGKVPHLAKGGIVNNPTFAMIGEDGPEAVIPLTQRNNPGGVGMGGGTYNITVNAGGITDRTDKRSLAREIGNMIQQEMARNIGGSTMRGRY